MCTVVRFPAIPIDLNQEKEQEHCRGELKLRIGHCPVVGGVPRVDQFFGGSLIKGKFMGGTESEISFQVGSSVQKYNLADIVSLKFDSEREASDQPKPSTSSLPSEPQPAEHAAMKTPAYVTIPAGTGISVRTIDAIDSTQNRVGDRFQASLEEPLRVDGNEIVSRDAAVYGRLEESKESGTFTGRSQLRLELTALVVNGQTVPIVTGDYELTGKSRGGGALRRERSAERLWDRSSAPSPAAAKEQRSARASARARAQGPK